MNAHQNLSPSSKPFTSFDSQDQLTLLKFMKIILIVLIWILVRLIHIHNFSKMNVLFFYHFSLPPSFLPILLLKNTLSNFSFCSRYFPVVTKEIILVPRGHLAISWNIISCHTWGRELLSASNEWKMLLNILKCTRWNPPSKKLSGLKGQ